MFSSYCRNKRLQYYDWQMVKIILNNCCLLNYSYIREYYKLIAIDLRKQEKLDADPKAIQQINFTGNLDRGGNT